MGDKVRYSDRLLVEAVRVCENRQALPDAEGVERSLDASAGLEKLCVQRARQLEAIAGVGQVLNLTRRRVQQSSFVICVVALLLGFVAAAQAFSDVTHQQVNFFWLLGLLIGLNILALAIWLVVTVFSPRDTDAVPSLAQGVLGVVKKWLRRGDERSITCKNAVTAGYFEHLAHTLVGTRRLSLLIHAYWCSYVFGGVLCVLLMLSIRHYTFVWETTILSTDQVYGVMRVVAWLPEQLGFPVPDASTFATSQMQSPLTPSVEEGDQLAIRQSWAGFLFGCLLVYGLLPRALLIIVYGYLYRRAKSQYRLDLSDAYYVNILRRVRPRSHYLGVVDEDEAPESRTDTTAPTADRSAPLLENCRVLGLEVNIDRHFLDQLPVTTSHYLGSADGREQQKAALKEIQRDTATPLLLVVSLLRTPDRGIARFAAQVVAHQKSHVQAVLADERRLQKQLNKVDSDARISDWFRIMTDAGIAPDAVHISELSTQLNVSEKGRIHA